MEQSPEIEKLKYPFGKYKRPELIREEDTKNWVNEIEMFPARLNKAVKDLSDIEQNWVYRPGGWTIKQVIHHCADSHMNAFVRIKLCLTEELPTIKPYLEDKWAELPDVSVAEISNSLKIIEGLHARWAILLKSLSSEEWERTFIHPEHKRPTSIKETACLYAWHANHHLAHVKQAIQRKGK